MAQLIVLRWKLIIAVGFLMMLTDCAYFNTFYNAQHYYAQAKRLVVHDTLKVDSEFWDKTIEKTTMVIVRYPGSPWVDDALFLMGAAYYYKGDYPQALEKFELFCSNYPNSKFYDDACYYKGLTLFKERRFSAAILALNEARASKQFKKRAAISLLYIYAGNNEHKPLLEMAQNLLKESLSIQEEKEVLNLMAEAQFKLKLYNDALATFNKLLGFSRTPEDKKALRLKIARSYLEMGNYEECRSFLAGQDDVEFRSLLATLNLKLGNIQEARAIYAELAHSNRPEFAALAYYELGRLYEAEDSLSRAAACYDSASAKSAGEYSAKARTKSDILKRIISLLNETENRDRAQFLLAETYFVELKDIPGALAKYEEVHKNFPKSEWAPKALYARLWITRNILKDDSLAQVLVAELKERYPNTEYTLSAMRMGYEKNGRE